MTDITVGLKFTSEASEFESTFQKPVESALSEFQKFVSGINSQTLEAVSGLNEGVKQLVSNVGNTITPKANAVAPNSTFSNSNRLNSPPPGELDQGTQNLIRFTLIPLLSLVGFVLGSAVSPGYGTVVGTAIGGVAGEVLSQKIIEAVEESNRASAARRQEQFQDQQNLPDSRLRLELQPVFPEEGLPELPPIEQDILIKPDNIDIEHNGPIKLPDITLDENGNILDLDGTIMKHITDPPLSQVTDDILNLNNALADGRPILDNFSLGGGLVTDAFVGVGVQAANAKEQIDNFGETTGDANINTGDLAGNTEDLADNFKDTKKQVAQAEKTVGKLEGTTSDLGVSLEKTDEVAQQLGENGLPKVKDSAEQECGDHYLLAA